MTKTRPAIRDELVQALLHRLEKDLSDLRNRSGTRIRFVPRQPLIDTISQDRVERLLETFRVHGKARNVPLRDLARYISPPEGGCHCQKAECTGARMILATLLLIGKEELVTEIFTSNGTAKELQICDQDLPFGTMIAQTERIGQGGHDEGVRLSANNPTQMQGADTKADAAVFHLLTPPEQELLSYFQWQFMSPYLTTLDLNEGAKEEPDEISLPWKELVQ
ncbi:hypothetical protein N0V93_005929 [Gnomoniopsis smithogilvyi]|uniref:Uncharacterized protein n=1 Tax=Gnomoniopsis smithogilvyi TaxID=1191159 RepID=A0A9W8YU75_9PEZI|nr:hypothetical protein N0V93_005929 [Gnomoniopsis smithogilvyi]